MKKFLASVFVAAALLIGGTLFVQAEDADAAMLLRVYNPNSGEHHYTANTNERNHLVKVGWRNEGNAWETPASGTAVYRLYNPNNGGDHHYTINANEKNHLVKVGWRYEGVSWQSGGSVPVYRLYNPNAKTGTHHYTLHASEKDHLVKVGWRYEGIGFYSTKAASNNNPNPGVTPKKVDVNITGVGGVEQGVSGSYRLLYSNKLFDQANLSGNARIDFSANVTMTGNKSDYEMQFVIAGNGKACGQVGVGLHYQAGSGANFAQGRINTTNINFPANSGVTGQQYYSVNTNAPRIANGQTVHLRVKYFASGYVQNFVNNTLVGQYKTNLTAEGGAYILHDTTNTPLKIRNLKVLRDGKDVTNSGRPSFANTNYDHSSGSFAGAY